MLENGVRWVGGGIPFHVRSEPELSALTFNWKDVSEYMYASGSTFKYGPTACKKRFMYKHGIVKTGTLVDDHAASRTSGSPG